MIRVNLSVELGKKRWKVSDLAKITGIRYQTLSDLYHEMTLSVKFEHLDKICEALECTVSDLIEYIPRK